jgi:preprotein translocase subunit SecG
METVIIVIHLMVVIGLVGVVLMQRSEGGALGIGGGNNFMTTRGQGNVLTRSTAILAAIFFGTSILLTILASVNTAPRSILDQLPEAPPAGPAPAGAPSNPGAGGILDQLPPRGDEPAQTPNAAPIPDDAGQAAPPADQAPAAPPVPDAQ